jgi:malate dehydrogenase (oxaloacetate-decarboxylating)(NADP+)
MAAEEMLRFGIKPKAALLSHFQLRLQQPAQRRQDAPRRWSCCACRRPGWKWTARCTATWRWTASARRLMPNSTLAGDANLLVLPNIDAANISYNLLKTAAGGNIAIGPVLLGAAKPVHILTASTTVRRIVNMTAMTVADAKRKPPTN